MATKKISELSAATTPLAGDELIEIVQGGNNKKLPVSSLPTADVSGKLNATGGQIAGYSETLETMTGTVIDVSTSNVKKKVLSANTTFTITGATTGRSHSFTLLLEGGSSYTVNWPASFKWLGGAPALTAKDVITGFSIDGGTQWIMSYAGSYV